jgi:hypothetical protein
MGVVVVLPHELSVNARAASLNDLLTYTRMTTPPRPRGLLFLPYLKKTQWVRVRMADVA